jgi:hypothetical protein
MVQQGGPSGPFMGHPSMVNNSGEKKDGTHHAMGRPSMVSDPGEKKDGTPHAMGRPSTMSDPSRGEGR